MTGLRWLVVRSLYWVAVCCSCAKAEDPQTGNWPQWRGPLGSGVAIDADPPTEWSETKNVQWKVPVPGLGHSTPIIWGDRIYLTTAVPFGTPLPTPQPDTAPGAHDNLLIDRHHHFAVIALSRETGEEIWQSTVAEALPHEGGHFSASLASNSPVTDGKHIVACFGSQGLFCLDLSGDVLWKMFPGRLHTKHGHGEGASPVLREGVVVINRDHEGESSIIAYKVSNGRELWSAKRDEPTSWASPVVARVAGRSQVIVAGTGFVRAYDLTSGEVIWRCGGLSANVVATPVVKDNIVVVGSSYDTRAIFAIDLEEARGDVTGTSTVLWQRSLRTPYVPSPIIVDDGVYFLRHYQGIMTRVDLHSGAEPSGPFRLGVLTDIYASPVTAQGRIYFVDLNGMCMVIRGGPNPKPLATNRLNESFAASPALVEDSIYLRGRESLYRISNDEKN